MNSNNFSEKMKDPIFKKHVMYSLLYALISLIILTVGVVATNDITKPALEISQKDKRAQEASDERKRSALDAKTKVDELIKTVKPELKVDTITEGTGNVVEVGDSLKVNYRGTNTKGQEFDSSLKEGRTPFALDNIGGSQVIAGWNAGIIGMKQGGKYKLFIPSKHAYGDTARGEFIPANEDLTFEIEVLEVDKTKNPYKS
jgi:FKBP-type peptidyl-prolyl cis-trans isomerase